MNPIELGKFLATLRNQKNLTQDELAEKLFIDKRKISRWECGTSIPEFDMLIKLSEILDVSLYELSIAKRIENKSISRKIINKFKSIKDFKIYKTKKIIILSIIILLLTAFIITSIYTIKYNNTMEVYKLRSLDDNYYLEGNYIRANKLSLFFIKKIDELNNCNYEIYNDDNRLFYLINDKNTYYETNKKINLKDKIKLKAICKKKNIDINIKLIKEYDNKIF